MIGAKMFKNKGEQCRVKFAPSVNFIIRRSVFKELGGMDEELVVERTSSSAAGFVLRISQSNIV